MLRIGVETKEQKFETINWVSWNELRSVKKTSLRQRSGCQEKQNNDGKITFDKTADVTPVEIVFLEKVIAEQMMH